MTLIRRWPASWMILLAFLITYAVGIPAMIALKPVEANLGLREEWLSLMVMRWGPTLAGFIVLAAVAGRKGFRVWLAQLLRWRVGLGYYLFIYLAALAIFAASVILTLAMVPIPPSPLEGVRPALDIAGYYLSEIAYITVNNGEETGWRFVLLGLLLNRMRLFGATFLVGIAWVLWHLPMYMLGGGGLPMFAPFIVNGLCLSVILSWLYKETDSLLLPILFHGAVNATTYAFLHEGGGFAQALDASGPLGEWLYAAAILPVAGAILLLKRRLFFDAPSFPEGENWAAPARR